MGAYIGALRYYSSSSYHTMHRPTTNESRSGFTLVEIMIVVIIIGLLAALAIPTIHNSQKAAKGATFINDVRTDLGAPGLPFVIATTGMRKRIKRPRKG